MVDWQAHFLLGMLGALAPEVIRIRNILKDGGTYTWSPALLFFSFLYAVIGGAVAAILPSANLLAAFYSGVSTDVLVNKAHTAAAGTKKRKDKVIRTKALGDAGPPPRLSPMDSFLDAL